MVNLLNNIPTHFRFRNLYPTLAFSLVSFVFLSTFVFAEEEKKFQLQVYLTKKQAFEIAFPGADEIKKDSKGDGGK